MAIEDFDEEEQELDLVDRLGTGHSRAVEFAEENMDHMEEEFEE